MTSVGKKSLGGSMNLSCNLPGVELRAGSAENRKEKSNGPARDPHTKLRPLRAAHTGPTVTCDTLPQGCCNHMLYSHKTLSAEFVAQSRALGIRCNGPRRGSEGEQRRVAEGLAATARDPYGLLTREAVGPVCQLLLAW